MVRLGRFPRPGAQEVDRRDTQNHRGGGGQAEGRPAQAPGSSGGWCAGGGASRLLAPAPLQDGLFEALGQGIGGLEPAGHRFAHGQAVFSKSAAIVTLFDMPSDGLVEGRIFVQ